MNNANVRQQIFDALNDALAPPGDPAPAPPLVTAPALTPEAKIARLTELMTAIRTEVHQATADTWPSLLQQVLAEKKARALAYGPGSEIGTAVEAAWKSGQQGANLPELVPYEATIESFKTNLFDIDAGITSTTGAVADVGAVIIWPTPEEPRLLSLVPPIHIAVLKASTIDDSLAEVMARNNWAGGMPTNALLISGPSKTADIEFQLVFGVHGPKEMVVIILTDQ